MQVSHVHQEPRMRNDQLSRITAALRHLSASERKLIAEELASLDAESASTTLVESRFATGHGCPHCQSGQVIRHGHANGLQRYRCKSCRRTFTALTGTPLNRLHKRELWLQQAEALADARPLRKIAQDIGIHVGTAHRWRHRFLALPEAIQPQALSGVAEVDETYFLLSFKGKRTLPRKARRRGGKATKRGLSHEQVPVLIARDRAGMTADCVLKTSNAETLTSVLKPLIPTDTVLCSDGSSALAAAARALGVEHHAVNVSAGARVVGPWHIQNVNAYHSRLKAWIAKFRGVATCYLHNYLGWFRTMDRTGTNRLNPAQWLALAVGLSA